MPHVVCGRCGRRTMIVTDDASAPCPRCGEMLALRPANRVIQVRHQIPILNWIINGAILAAFVFGVYWAYGWVVRTLNKPPDTSFGVKRYPGSDSSSRAPIPDTAPPRRFRPSRLRRLLRHRRSRWTSPRSRRSLPSR